MAAVWGCGHYITFFLYNAHRSSSKKYWMDDKDKWKSPVQLLDEMLNNTASAHTGKTHKQLEPSTLPDCPTLQQALCKHFWALQHVFSWKSRGYYSRSCRKVVYSAACNYNLATWQLVNDCVWSRGHRKATYTMLNSPFYNLLVLF